MLKDFNQFRAGISLYLAVVFLAACTAFGLAAPQTLNEKIAYAFGSVTTIRVTATNLLEGGTITATEAAKVQAGADLARQSLEAARAASSAGDVTTAEGKLATAQSILNTLQAIIKSRSGS